MTAMARARSLLTTQGRADRSFRARVVASLAVIVGLHVLGLALLLLGRAGGAAGALSIAVVGFAYLRGLVHALDFDHVSMIDNSTRKFVAEGRDPASVGLAFSLGHSSVVILTGVLVIAGAGVARTALDPGSGLAIVLGAIGLTVSGLYLLLVAVANLATFRQAWQLRAALRHQPDLVIDAEALAPRGPAARVMTAPLRRIRHPRHVYVIGFLFSLGFDTSSQIGLLVLTGTAALAGAPLLSLLALPVLFTAAMTLGDTLNGLLMLRLYRRVQEAPAQKLTYNLAVTGIGIASAVAVALFAASALLTEQAGWRVEPLVALAEVDTEYAGFGLAAVFLLVGAGLGIAHLRRRWRPA